MLKLFSKYITSRLFGKDKNNCLSIKPPSFDTSDSVLIKLYDICNIEEKKTRLN